MEIVIDIDSDVPLFAQLIGQIKQAVLAGGIGPGDQLPSIRQLANDLELNQKTVAKAYRLLERDAVIVTRGFRGTFIHADAKANCTVNLASVAEKTLADAVARLRRAGVTDSEIRIAFAGVLGQRTASGA